MAVTSGSVGTLATQGCAPVMPGSGKASWKTSHSNATAADTTYLVDPLNASVSSNVVAIPIPDGATRVLVRGRAVVSGYSHTTNPVVRLWVSDGTYPTRIDNTDQSAAGITLTFDSTGGNNAKDSSGTYYVSDLSTLDGYDCLGGSTLYTLVETAANLGSACVVQVAFLN